MALRRKTYRRAKTAFSGGLSNTVRSLFPLGRPLPSVTCGVGSPFKLPPCLHGDFFDVLLTDSAWCCEKDYMPGTLSSALASDTGPDADLQIKPRPITKAICDPITELGKVRQERAQRQPHFRLTDVSCLVHLLAWHRPQVGRCAYPISRVGLESTPGEDATV